MKDVVVEAIVVGLSVVVMGIIVRMVIGVKTMEIYLFLIGFLLHIAYEAAGANEWYSRRFMA